jgi:hypothetical protein
VKKKAPDRRKAALIEKLNAAQPIPDLWHIAGRMPNEQEKKRICGGDEHEHENGCPAPMAREALDKLREDCP